MYVCEERLEKRKMSSLSGTGRVHEFYRLKALTTLEQANTSVVEKKEES